MRPIPPPSPPPPRRLPEQALPPYRYVPGLGPHPFRDPAGHLYCGGGPPAPPRCAERAWLWGMDLFDHRYCWEAHEVWESLWRAAPRGEARAELLQGLIQAAAFTLKWHMGQPRSARRLLAASRGRLLGARGSRWHGLDLDRTVAQLEGFAAGGPWPLLAPARDFMRHR